MDEDWSHAAENILKLTLEIIHLLTGKPIPPLFLESLTITVSPPCDIQQKIKRVTNKITEILTGEVPVKREELAACLFKAERKYPEEHKEHYKEAKMEDQKRHPSLDGSGFKKKKDKEFLYPSKSTPDNPKRAHHQNGDLIIMKFKVKDEACKLNNDQPMEEDIPYKSDLDPKNSKENPSKMTSPEEQGLSIKIKEEEEALEIGADGNYTMDGQPDAEEADKMTDGSPGDHSALPFYPGLYGDHTLPPDPFGHRMMDNLLPVSVDLAHWYSQHQQCTEILSPMKKRRSESNRKKIMITVEVKKEIIKKHERGMRVADIARYYNKSTSTICSILKRKEEIRGLDAAKGITRVSKQRPRVLEDVEKLLLVWINEKQMAGEYLTESVICDKAKCLFADLASKVPGPSTESEEVFKASRGWFDNFKRRSGIHNVMKQREAASSEAKAAEAFSAEFQNLMVSECYLPQQVFNCNETGLFWKRMPKRTYITAEECALPGHKPMKDRLTLLLCSNASGDVKMKPLLVYHSENPRAFKKYKVQKNQLDVMWRSNSKALVTRLLFIEWINEVFGPTVKKYLLEKNLPLKVLLVMDNAPAHPHDLKGEVLEEFDFIEVKLLPANTTPLLQPLDQQVITNFKQLYTRALFELCFEATEGTNLSLREFWKNHFDIVNCINIIDKAWDWISKRTLNSAWRKLWPECVFGNEYEGFAQEQQEPPVVDHILSLAEIMGLEVNEDDIHELVEEPCLELTTDELIDLHREQRQQEAMEEMSSEEEDKKAEEALNSSEIMEMCDMWEKVQNFVANKHPNKAVAMRVINLFNDNAMSYFRQILIRRQKQVSFDSLFVKVPQKEDFTEPTDSRSLLHMQQPSSSHMQQPSSSHMQQPSSSHLPLTSHMLQPSSPHLPQASSSPLALTSHMQQPSSSALPLTSHIKQRSSPLTLTSHMQQRSSPLPLTSHMQQRSSSPLPQPSSPLALTSHDSF